jgi:hypothetical protein
MPQISVKSLPQAADHLKKPVCTFLPPSSLLWGSKLEAKD